MKKKNSRKDVITKHHRILNLFVNILRTPLVNQYH